MVAKNEINRGHRTVDVVELPVAAPPSAVEVLVVGAGPSGLAAATELRRHGIDVAVVDAARRFPLVRAGAMGHSPRTVELFEQWGVLDRIRRAWTFPPEWNVGIPLRTSLVGHDLAQTPRRQFAPSSSSPHSFKQPIRRPQTAVQQAFLDELAARGVPVSGLHRVEGLSDDAETGVTVSVVGVESGQRQTIRARYVIGADGARSTIRRLAGIEREGEYATERHFRFVVRTSGDYAGRVPFPSGTNVIVNQVHSGFLSAYNETDWRVYAGPYPLDQRPTDAELLELARAAFGEDLDLEIVDVSPFFRSTRIASTFRRGRVVVVGDAAHVRAPGGNLGEGFGDVANLGWKLAAVIRDQGGEALLDSYDQERRPHNWRVATHAQARAEAGERAVREARALGFPDDGDLSEEAVARRAEIGRLLRSDADGPSRGVVFDERYDASEVIWYDEGQDLTDAPWQPHVYEPTGRPGHRAPNGNVDPFGGTVYDRLGSHVALLALAGATGTVDAFEAAAQARGIDLEVIHLPDADVRDLYGADHVLVRPDHHVAWRCDGTDVDAGAVLDRVYGRAAASTTRSAPQGAGVPAVAAG